MCLSTLYILGLSDDFLHSDMWCALALLDNITISVWAQVFVFLVLLHPQEIDLIL